MSESKVQQLVISKETIKVLLGVAAKTDIRYYLNAILFHVEQDKVHLVATDGHRLVKATANVENTNSNYKVLVHRTSFETWAKILKTKEYLTLNFNSETLIDANIGYSKFNYTVQEGNFPDYNRVIPEFNESLIVPWHIDQIGFEYLVEYRRAFNSIVSCKQYMQCPLIALTRNGESSVHNYLSVFETEKDNKSYCNALKFTYIIMAKRAEEYKEHVLQYFKG